MTDVDTVKLSSKGQVVIPRHLREELNINRGDNLIVAKKGNSLILRKLTLEDMAEETDRQLEEGETLSIEETFEGLI